MDDRGSILSRSRDFFFFATKFKPALGPTQHPIGWVQGDISLGLKWPGREATEVENAWSYTPLPHTSSWRGA
jgi:hypothetical protein